MTDSFANLNVNEDPSENCESPLTSAETPEIPTGRIGKKNTFDYLDQVGAPIRVDKKERILGKDKFLKSGNKMEKTKKRPIRSIKSAQVNFTLPQWAIVRSNKLGTSPSKVVNQLEEPAQLEEVSFYRKEEASDSEFVNEAACPLDA